ncbi:guided entry of tail-anchored proteins factor 1 [Euwallacea similis]|uniref:guided entry of tail-anchored proteins factor 1 n=1 Tax=Euwallacea similis TaxID=1736056 RepID=UPI00344F22CC
MFILLIITTTLSFLNAQSSFLNNVAKKWSNMPSSTRRELQKEKQNLKAEQRQYNMMDSFAKYSKLQRKINVVDEKLEDCAEKENPIWWQIVVAYGPRAVCTLILLSLTLYYGRTPLFKIPDYVDLTPFNFFISYPNERNYVSFHFWIMSCNVVARLIKV